MPCPVLANGNVSSARRGLEILEMTGARGLMIGRGAIRNPWIFDQFRRAWAGETAPHPRGREVLAYVRDLFETVRPPGISTAIHVQKMKKYINFLGVGVDAKGEFLHAIRRVSEESEFFKICEAFLDHDNLMTLEPFSLELPEKDALAGEHQ